MAALNVTITEIQRTSKCFRFRTSLASLVETPSAFDLAPLYTDPVIQPFGQQAGGATSQVGAAMIAKEVKPQSLTTRLRRL